MSRRFIIAIAFSIEVYFIIGSQEIGLTEERSAILRYIPAKTSTPLLLFAREDHLAEKNGNIENFGGLFVSGIVSTIVAHNDYSNMMGV